MHGDCTSRNILISGDRVEFIDWEWSRVVQFPGFDILNFLWRDRMSPDDSGCLWSRPVFAERMADTQARDRFHLVHPNADWESSVLTFWAVRMARGIFTERLRGNLSNWVDQVMRPSLNAAKEVVHDAL
jgi:thiamine kinase-like enzyme